MKKLLFIVPHLSTGGMPQFVLKQIEILKEEYDISLVEWENITGGVYVVQRNAVESILGSKFHSLSANKTELLSIMSDIEPDIIHFHEIPETFVNTGILNNIYSTKTPFLLFLCFYSVFVFFQNCFYSVRC